MPRTMCWIVLLLLAAGCQSPPTPDADYTETAEKVRLAASSMELEDSASPLPVEADLQGTHPVDFYVQIALERNPDILAARRELAAQVNVIPQATALDDPVLADTFQPFDHHSVQTAAGRGVNTLSLTQRFPWFGKLRIRGEMAEQNARIAQARFAQSQLKVIQDVKLAYFELYFTQRAIQITEEDAELLKDLLKFAEARYRTGKTSQQDVLRAQVELENLRDRLIVLRRQLRQAQADLARQLHASPESNLKADGLPEESAPRQIELLYEAAVRCRPELKERLHAIVRDQRSEELARLQYYPDVTLGVGWQAITNGAAISPVSNGNDNVAFTVGINLPIWQDKLRAGVQEAEQRVLASARRYDAERDDTYRQIKRLVVQAEALDAQIKLFRESIIPKALQTLRVSVADYRVGKIDFQQIIDNWSDLLKFQTQLFRLEASLGQTLAVLERTLGCQLADITQTDAGSGAKAGGQKAGKKKAVPPAPPAPKQPKR